MKFAIKQFCSMLVVVFLSLPAGFAQVDVSTGGPSTSYPDLKSAFNAINTGIYTGIISIGISGSTTETASAVLNASGNGPASYSSIVISPTGGAARTISGNISGHLIKLNGADTVTIDGLNTGGNSLTITNTGTNFASTIGFDADASNNMITNCSLKGSSAIWGVVTILGGTITGNDNNIISNCNIGPAGVINPVNGIYSFGTISIPSSGNIISNNNIYDYFSALSVTTGIKLNNNYGWIITGNRLFQTTNRIYTTANTHYGIQINAGDGFIITNNVIGFANPEGTGTTNLIGLTSGSLGGTFPGAYTVGGTPNNTTYIAISCSFFVNGTVSSIQNNTIAGFALFTGSANSEGTGVFCGIAVFEGNADIGTSTGNKIGTATSSIYTSTTHSGGGIVGIVSGSKNTVTIQNNIITNLDAMGTVENLVIGAGSITGIKSGGLAGTVIISGNIIGSETNPDLRMGILSSGTSLSNVGTTFGPTSGNCKFRGIYCNGNQFTTIGTSTAPNIIRNSQISSTHDQATFTGIFSGGSTTNVSFNTINNLQTGSRDSLISWARLTGAGILVVECTNPIISNNTIKSLSLTNNGTGGFPLAGIAYQMPYSSISITKNNISGLSNASTSTNPATPGTATGIMILEGWGANSMISNNSIALGTGQTTNTSYAGIWAQYPNPTATTLKIYHNTINIEGAVAIGAQPSMCIHRGDFSAIAKTAFTIDAKNNILNNARYGGTGKHYAIANQYGAAVSSAIGWGANATNFNVLNGNPATIGYWSGDQTFSGWLSASASDINSLSGIPVAFVNSATGNLHLNLGMSPTQIESGGMDIPAVLTDIDGDERPGPVPSNNGGGTAPDFGSDEFDGVLAGMVVTGSASATFCYNSPSTITATGFTVAVPSGNVTLIAGQRIFFEPGTIVQSGAYLHGYISDGFCNPVLSPVTAAVTGEEEPRSYRSDALFMLYPNPARGNFTLDQKGNRQFVKISIEVYGMHGNKVLSSLMTGEKKHEFATQALPAGIYFVKVIADDYITTMKLIRTR